MWLPLAYLDPITLLHFYFTFVHFIYFQKARFCSILWSSKQLHLFFIYLYCNFRWIRSYFTTCGWVDVDSTPCIVFCIIYTYILRECITVKSTKAVDVSIIETTAGYTENCNRIVSNILPGIGSDILPLAWLDVWWTVISSDHLDVLVLNHCSTEHTSFVVHILLFHHSAVLQVQLPAGIIYITIILSPYEVDGALSCHGGKVVISKVGDVLYGLGFVRVLVTLHTFHSDVFERLGARLKRISYYALRLILNRVFNINLLVLNFSFGIGDTRFNFFTRILVIIFHLGC